MTKAILAINGGEHAVRVPLKRYNPISVKVLEDAESALRSTLSGYLGGGSNGGYWCEKLEGLYREKLGVKHALAVNSATSGILAACDAVGIVSGSLAATSPYTMSGGIAPASVLGAAVDFIDIEKDTFCIDPEKFKEYLDADIPDVLIVPNIFGHAAQLQILKSLCDSKGIPMIEDNAQSPFAKEYDRYAGTVGDVGVFSLNVHKHIQCGEGGIVVTDDDFIANEIRGFRNHGELAGGCPGLNLRMTEVSAAIACAQVENADAIIDNRISFAEMFNEIVKPYGAVIKAPKTRIGNKHVYYVWAGQVDSDRDWFCSALNAEGMPIVPGYSKLYLIPAFKREEELYPITNLVDSQMAMVEICAYDPSDDQRRQIMEAFDKVCEEAVKRKQRHA